MSIFNWFSDKSSHSKKSADDSDSSGRSQPSTQPRQATDPVNRSEERRAKRHARREQLYIAVRESMTYCGVLSASYKFKVLSLDQRGDQFLVMMDVDKSFDGQADRLADIENKIIQTARARFHILVTSLYWRIDPNGTPGRPKPAGYEPGHMSAMFGGEATHSPGKKPALRYDPIQDDEVAAFKQALAAASSNSPVATDGTGKVRSAPRSYTLLTGFEDTEMLESSAAPVLSNTQYGDLI
ncbi:MAG: hypothetical protein H7228_12525 [Polaromonas sp.]|nr:hypothetical protein [Polaromonas sp.]